MQAQAVPKARFKIVEFVNPRTGSGAWRVTGTKRNGERVRENFADIQSAQCRQIELEGEFLARHADTTLRATRLTDTQIHLAELAFSRLNDDADMPRAIDYWLKHGKQLSVAVSPRIDEAADRFKAWLDGEADENGNGICTLREHSRSGLRIRVNIFANSIGNLRVNDVTPDTIENFIGRLNVSNTTRDNYRRAVSRFFSWCIARPRRWVTLNPCREIKVEREEKGPPAILTLAECTQLLRAAEPVGLAPYVSLCLYAGLRPFEATRLTWQAVNLEDKEIRLEANQTKTGRARVVTIGPTLLAWLRTYQDEPFFPPNWRRVFDTVKSAAGFTGRSEGEDKGKPWPVDVMRHTAISHFFRKTGSYGLTAEQFGNSEAIIKKHYQGRVSSADSKRFYALRPLSR